MNESELLNILSTEIPIGRALGISELKLQGQQLLLKIPLTPNLNHKKTMFGGSLYSACALACYGLFLNSLRNWHIATNNIVIADGKIRYLLPVSEDAEVLCQWPSEDSEEEFFKKLKSKGRAKSLIQAKVFCQGKLCVEFEGNFVAITDKK